MKAKIDPNSAPAINGSRYPSPYDAPCKGRSRRRLGDLAGLTQFGVNITRLPPGGWSSQRHWHTTEDEFIYVIEGEAVLVTDDGEETLRAGDCAGFKAGVANGHQLQNRSDRDVLLLEIGARNPDADEVLYPGIDLKVVKGQFVHADGRPYRSDDADAAGRVGE